MLSMMHAPGLNSHQMQCGTTHQENSLSVSTRHSHLGKLGSKYQGHPVVHMQLPPMVISLSLKGVPYRVACPQVQVFLLMRNYKYS